MRSLNHITATIIIENGNYPGTLGLSLMDGNVGMFNPQVGWSPKLPSCTGCGAAAGAGAGKLDA